MTKEMREKVPEPKTDQGVKDIPNAKGFHAQDGAFKETIKNKDVIYPRSCKINFCSMVLDVVHIGTEGKS